MSDNSQLLFNYNESASAWIAIRNGSHLINTQLSCQNITGIGGDTDFCVDSTSSDGNSGGISNLTSIINTDTYILTNYTGNPNTNSTFIVNLSFGVIRWLYNQSDNSQLLFNYNETTFLLNTYGSNWYNHSLSLLGMTNTWTVQQTFNINTLITNATITNNLQVIGNTTLQNLTVTDLKTCDIKSNGIGQFYCGIDATGTGGTFSNAISNLTALVNTDGYIAINISGASNGINNQTLLVNLTFNTIRWLYNQSDNSQLLFNYNQTEIGKWAYNQSDNVQLLFNYNETSAMLNQPLSWVQVQTFNNITVQGNVTIPTINNVISFEQGNVTIGANNTAFVIKAWNMRDIWYRP